MASMATMAGVSPCVSSSPRRCSHTSPCLRRVCTTSSAIWLTCGRLQVVAVAAGSLRGRLHIAEVGQDAAQHLLQAFAVDLLCRAQRLAAPAHREAAQLDRRAEAFGEIGRVEHRVEQLQQAVLERMASSSCPRGSGRYSFRVSSGTTPLVAWVPPSAPTSSIGTSTASQPVRNEKSGRSGRTAAIIRIMNARSPEESLMPTIRSNSASRWMVGTSIGTGEHRDVVERDVDRAVQRDLAEIGVDRFRAEPVVERRDDRHGPRAKSGVGLAGGERFADVGLGGAGQHRHAPGRLLADDLDDPPALLRR